MGVYWFKHFHFFILFSFVCGRDTYIWKFRVRLAVGEESVGAQIVFKAPAEITIKVKQRRHEF